MLAVDLDPQGNLSDYLDVDPDASPTIGDVLSGRATASEAVHDGIIPANLWGWPSPSWPSAAKWAGS